MPLSHHRSWARRRGSSWARRRGTRCPFLGIRFDCCRVYTRLYPNRAGNAYEGHCPRCLRKLRIPIDPAAGVRDRFFLAW